MTLQEWLIANDLKLETEVCEEWLDADGGEASHDGATYFICPFFIARTDETGTRILDDNDEEEFRDEYESLAP